MTTIPPVVPLVISTSIYYVGRHISQFHNYDSEVLASTTACSLATYYIAIPGPPQLHNIHCSGTPFVPIDL